MTTTYTKIGDYLLPNLIPPESPRVGRWGMLRYSYLRNHREVIYAGMLMKVPVMKMNPVTAWGFRSSMVLAGNYSSSLLTGHPKPD